jgi:hypothetical protein
MSAPTYSLQITEEGLERLNTTFLEAVRLVCETAVTVAQSKGDRGLERARVEADSALAVAKVEAESALALAKVKAASDLEIVKAGGKQSPTY